MTVAEKKRTVERLTQPPAVFLVAKTVPTSGMNRYLYSGPEVFGADLKETGSVMDDRPMDMQTLSEFAGRLCYRSWSDKPGASGNTNLTRVRRGQKEYLEHILEVGHLNVLRHVSMSFLIAGCTRVCTHELVRHHVGVAVSQESLRYVRLSEVDIHVPEEVLCENEKLTQYFMNGWARLQDLQRGLDHFLDGSAVPFSEKKSKTSAFRRLMGMGVRTNILFTANLEALRNLVEKRLCPEAETEIREVVTRILLLCHHECPDIFADLLERAGIHAYTPVKQQ
jgi:thymidylate synthase (FAD)